MTEGPHGPHEGEGAREDPVGSAAEEAAKLIGALGDWARDHRSEAGDLGGSLASGLAAGLASGLSGLAAHAAALAADVNRNLDDHLATGAPECTYCPICRTVHIVREASPEVRAHLASAAASLMEAAASVLDAASSGPTRRRTAGVEKIDLDDNQDDPWPDPWEEQ